MKDEVREFAARLKPPAAHADPEVVMAWRWFVAIVTGVNTLTITAHIVLACGFLPVLFPGFATASENEGLRLEMVRVQVALEQKRAKELPGLMLDAKQKQCMASGEARRLYFNTYNDLRAEYYELTKREFPDPSCTDFS